MSEEHQIAENLRPARVLKGQKVPWTITDRLARYNVPAVSVAVIDDLEIQAVGAWGQLERGKPDLVTPTTLFQTASISKSVTAAGALCLVKDGLLNLDTDVEKELPEQYLPDGHLPGKTYADPVTLRLLLSHSAGISVPGFAGYMMDDPLPTLAQMLAGQPPANSPAVERYAPPDEHFSYSGGGYLLVQALMETVTGEPFARVMQTRVFDPLGMENSCYAPLDRRLYDQAASGHTEAGEVLPGKAPIHAESAAGGLWSTPTDLARLMLAIMQAYRGKDTPILTPQLAQAMLTPRFWDFGLGVRLQGEGEDMSFNHGGATLCWHGQFIAYPERGQGVAVLTNSANGYLLWPEVERGVAHILGWPGWDPQLVDPLEMSHADLESYTGTYLLGGNIEITVESRSGGIEVVYEGITWPAVPTAPDSFELLELEGQVTFQRDAEDKLTGFDLWFGVPGWSPYRQWHFDKQ